ncbi:MAG: hypothetical protein ABUT39_24265 [Acidobacteriota bacterium]
MSSGGPLAGMEPTADWHARQHFNFLFEIETRAVEPLLPARIGPVEVRTGISVLNVGYMSFAPGSLGTLPAFEEITFSIQVQPDLSLDMPVPRLAVFDLRIGSNCREFLDFEAEHQRLSGDHSATLAGRINPAQDRLEVSDRDGRIFVFENTHPAPLFKRETAYGQYYAQREDGLYQGVFQWEGIGCEHQREGEGGRLFNHPFFRELDVEDLVQDCYMQMFLAPDTGALFRSFRPRRLC